MFSTYFDAADFTQSISPESRLRCWHHSRQQQNPWAQWNAYLNQLCLTTCLREFKAEGLPVKGMNDRTNDRTWALLNGSVMTLGDVRIVLLPTEVVDQSELEVPQEWIDIPSWAADYYFAIYITPDTETLHIAGYATHQQIKRQGKLNRQDRSYHLDNEALTPDLNLLWLTCDRFSSEQTREAIAAPSSISQIQAGNLIDRLTPELLPRLEIPFTLWSALLANPQWHEQLYRQRQGEAVTLVTRLDRWLQGQFDAAWQPVERVLAPQTVTTRGNGSDTANRVNRAKVIAFDDGEVGLMINLSPTQENEVRIDLQIHPIGDSLNLPGETQLRLLSEDGQEIAQAKAAVTETIRLQFRAHSGESFQVEITCKGQLVMEQFQF